MAISSLRADDQLTVQSLRTYRGVPIKDEISSYEVRRELPEAAHDSHDWRRALGRASRPLTRQRLRRRAVANGSFDICHLHSISYLSDWIDVPVLSRQATLVATVHDVRPHRRVLPTKLETSLLRAVYERAVRLVVYHDVLRNELLEDFGLDAEHVAVVPHPIHAPGPTTKPSPPKERPLRTALHRLAACSIR